jgi:hypothetical protein
MKLTRREPYDIYDSDIENKIGKHIFWGNEQARVMNVDYRNTAPNHNLDLSWVE